MNKLGIMIAIVSDAFVDKEDKGGQPYILHCLHVMNQMPEKDEELRQAAVGHDLIEDTDWTLEDLRDYKISERVINIIDILTHVKGVPYMDYIKRISTSPDAVKIKLADLRHNSDITRMKGLTKKDFDRLEKYHQAYAYLSKI